MRAIILAAGVGRRLSDLTTDIPKCLLVVDGKTLLSRHMECLLAAGVNKVTVVVGYLAEQIEAELIPWKRKIAVDTVFNSEFRKGSILSLYHGVKSIETKPEDVLVMDADVLYHTEVLARLVRARTPNCFLMDITAEETGEEMMLGAKAGRVWKIARRVGMDWDTVGEGVGFFKISGKDMLSLLAVLQAFREAGTVDVEYESAIDTFIKEFYAGFVPVGDLPWTEIDFPEDVVKAREVILPLIRALNKTEVDCRT